MVVVFLANLYSAVINSEILFLALSVLLFPPALFTTDLIASLICRFCIPKSFYNPERKIFKELSFEKKFYSAIRVTKWKDKIPEIGKAIGFGKTKLDSTTPEYIYHFAVETCYAGFMHVWMGLSGFLLLIFYPIESVSIWLPLIVVNWFLNLLPIFIQRFNRPKLVKIYKLKSKMASKNISA